jgi:hypothetical protein
VRAAARSLPVSGRNGTDRDVAEACVGTAAEWDTGRAVRAAATVVDPNAGIAATSTTQKIQIGNRLVAIIGARLH